MTISRDKLKTSGSVTPALFRSMMKAAADAIFAQRNYLCELDGALGDGDHGVTMEIGWKAILVSLDQAEDAATISELCETMADAFLDAVGASVGPLYATAFSTAGTAVADRLNLDSAAMVAWLEGMTQGIAIRGGAQAGDKTMLDAWQAAVDSAAQTLEQGGMVEACLVAAAQGAQGGAEATIAMQSNRGRSKKLGKRSIGHQDPGATSTAIIMAALAAEVVNERA